MMMPPMSDPSEPSERMERADNPSKGAKWAMILGGVAALGTAAYFLTRSKRHPLPSQDQIASGAVPGVTLNAPAQVGTVTQVGLKKVSNPFGTVSSTSDAATYQSKLNDIQNWSRPIVAYGMMQPMEVASMAGYRRLNGPFDALQSGLATVQQAANTVTNYTNTAQTGLQKVENTVNRVTSATQSSTSPVAPSDSGWGAVRDWARTGRAPSGLNAPNATLYAYRLWDWVPLHFVRAFEPASFQTLDDLRRSDRAHSRPATNAQIDIAHRVMRQAYDLWTRAGAYATVVIDGKPTAIFQLFQNNLNKG